MKELTVNHPPLDFERIWLKRWNQDIEGALQGLAFIQQSRGWERLDTHLLGHAFTEEYDELVEALLLKASLLRAQGSQTESSQLISRIYRMYSRVDRPLPFRLAFEVAVDFWLREDHNQALEFFLLAEQKAKSDIQKLFCYANMLWILETFDLEREKVERQLEAKLNDFSSGIQSTAVRSISDQYRVYLLRKRFFSGELSPLEIDPLANFSQTLNQSVFFSLFLNRLPYFMGHKIEDLGRGLGLFSKNHLWQGSYRLRTLSGILTPSDSHLYRCGDAIDRLYLWTWMYMAGVEEISLEKIEVTLTSIGSQIELERLSVENRLLLRNAVKWLSLLVPRMTLPFKAIIERDFGNSLSYPVLESEFLFADLLTKSSDDINLTDLPYHFSLDERLMPRLVQALQENKKIQSLKSDAVNLVVDRANQEIRCFKSGEIVRSEGLTELFTHLAQNPSVKIELLGKDYLNDRRKLYNLISRAKTILPEAQIRVETNHVVLDNPQALKIYVSAQDLSPKSGDLKAASLRGARAGAREKLVSKEAAQVVFKDGFDRSQIEESFGVSKAKACRVIAGWLEDGCLIRVGSGKSMFYTWRKP